MNLSKFLESKLDLEKEKVILYYKGPVFQSLMEEMGETVIKQIRLPENFHHKRERLFFIFVELVQNIIRYSRVKVQTLQIEPELKDGVFVLGEKEGNIYCIAGNPIYTTDVDRIEKKIKKILDMTQNELREYYKEKRRLSPDADSVGAGLGFIEIARKSIEPISYSFDPMSEDLSFFSMRIII